MVDKTKIDFNYSIEQIKRDIPNEVTPQDNILNSDTMNESFKNIENSLNQLYENTRYLEDAIDYCNAFLNLKIADYSDQIKTTLKSIEEVRDINKNNSYLEYQVAFKDDMSVKKDRDNSLLPLASSNVDFITLGTKKEQPIDWNDISKKSAFIPYKSNIENIKNEFYRSFYIEEKVASKGIVESITITLDNPTKVNFINIASVNADIENFRIVYLNGVESYVDYTTDLIKEEIITQIKFDLVCKKYETSTYYMDKRKITDDVWNEIKEYEYKYALDVNSKLEMEEVIARIHGKDVDIYNNQISKNNVLEKKMYTYMFGIDSISIKYVEQEMDSCFISESINIGTLAEGEYIQLHVNDNRSDTFGIEYSLLDGDVEIPILPYGINIIKNEKLFPTLDLRYKDVTTGDYVIKKDGMTTNISIDDAKQQMLSRFSIDYFPDLKYNYTTINSNIRIKAVLRKYGNAIDNSYIKQIKIRKYGGETPWTDLQKD